jgi:hypothetical protein
VSLALKNQWPLRLIIRSEDCTFLLDNGGTFSNADPGGFEAASFSIPKDMPQTLRGMPVRLDSGVDRQQLSARVKPGRRGPVVEPVGACPDDHRQLREPLPADLRIVV